VRTQGSLIADEVTTVGAEVAGRVHDINVDLGDVVAAGAVLATLDQEEFKLQISLVEAQLMQSRAALGLRPSEPAESLDPQLAPPVREAKAVWDETRTRIDRMRQLQQRARNAVTQEELDQAVAAEGAADARHAAAVNAVREKIAQIKVRESELEVAKQHLADTVMYAPTDEHHDPSMPETWLVQQRHVGRGSFVQVGDAIVTLVRTSTLRFHGTVPERHARRLALGEQVTLRIEGIDEPRVASVTRISPTVDEMSRSLVFEAQVDNRDGTLRTGLFAEAEVVVDPEARALIIPKDSLVEFAGAEKVWKVTSGVAREQIVQTGRHTDRGIEIVKFLAPGDMILASAVEGSVARIDPIFDQPAAPGPPDSEPTEVIAGEELEPTTTDNAPLAPADHAVAR
jgi:RND family efflux transporter MFP subunit